MMAMIVMMAIIMMIVMIATMTMMVMKVMKVMMVMMMNGGKDGDDGNNGDDGDDGDDNGGLWMRQWGCAMTASIVLSDTHPIMQSLRIMQLCDLHWPLVLTRASLQERWK